MVSEALINANSKYHFEKIIQDPNEYMKLTDHILKEIEFSKEPVNYSKLSLTDRN
jgi:hypothetical protein